MAGLLVVAAAPIGNAADTPPRLADELARADVVAAEDTRRLRRLLSVLGLPSPPRVVSYFEGNEGRRTDELVAALRDGARVLLVSDAGTPGVSDPGYRLVSGAIEAGVAVTVVPGPSAVTAALVVSGLPVDRWCFEGFLPRRRAERARRLAQLAAERRTMVFFEAPRRLAAALAAMVEAFGPDRAGAVCRELTKTHEEVVRGPLAQLASWAAGGVRGETTVVVAGAGAAAAAGAGDPGELAARVTEREATGETRKAAIAGVAASAGVPKRAVYDAVLAARAPSEGTER
ncbi:MAG: 16S rRNA (cytidine(1402)-2'-O)-methyltransferase [Mycobacterium leprae]